MRSRTFSRAWRLGREYGWNELASRARFEAVRRVRRLGNRSLRGRAGAKWRRAVGMTTPEELAWLADHVANEVQGVGSLVDLGCFLGSSTEAMAEGLVRNPRAGGSEIHAYDLFRWESWMEQSVAGTPVADRFSEGESFLPYVAKRLAPWGERVVLHEGDLLEETWSGGPIELLFVDAAKSLALGNALARNFLPALVPGAGVVVEQDFAHYFTPWVHVRAFRRRDAFRTVVHVPFSGSVVFRYARELDGEELARPVIPAEVSEEELEAIFDWALLQVEAWMRPNVWAARVMWEIHFGSAEGARRALELGRRKGFRGLDLARVERHLAGAFS